MRGGYVRGWAEYLYGARIRFYWPCGHTRVTDYSKQPVTKRMGEIACRMMASWWSKEKGGVNLKPCGRCK